MENCSYTWNAGDYAAHSSAQLGWAQELIAKLDIQGQEHVLDVGCGDGKISALLAATVSRGSVTGIDLSVDMISLADQGPGREYSNLRFLEMDAAALGFDAEFDIAFSNAALHWIRDHQPVLAGMARALKPGGHFLLQMGGQGNAAGILSALGTLRQKEEWGRHFEGFEFPYGFYSETEYRPWLEAAGLEAERIELIPKDMIQDGRKGLMGWVRTTWLPYTDQVPADQRENFVEDIADTYLAEHPLDDEGQAHVAMVRLEVQGRRPEETLE
jgi:trans-aconitate 2-methyltransferase